MELRIDRRTAIAETIAGVRAVESALGVSRAALAQIERLLLALARRVELFPADAFATRTGHGTIYLLAEDPDGRFALYASAGVPGKAQVPHDHTTWAVIAGVRGVERNTVFERTDDRRTAGVGTLRRLRTVDVGPGTSVAYMPDDVHAIEVIGSEPSLHLHLYGMSLERLPERVRFEHESGGRCWPFPPNPNIDKRHADAAGQPSALAVAPIRPSARWA